MHVQHLSIIEALRLTPFLAKASVDDLARLAADARRLTYASRQTLFRQGDAATAFFIVLAGHVALYLDGDDNPAHLARICGPGETFGEWCICCEDTCPVTARSFGPVELITIAGDALTELFHANPDIAQALIAQQSARLRGLVRQLMDLKMKSAAQRVGGYFLELAQRREGRCEIRLPFEKKLLAHHLGMQPETLSRILVKLQSVGVRYHRASDAFRIDDAAALREFCDEPGTASVVANYAAEC